MGIRKSQAITIRPKGLADAIDGTNVPLGSMSILKDLVPNPTTPGQFVPRVASVQASAFAGFTTPAGGTALKVVGTKVYGFISSARNANKDEPFVYDLATGTFATISNITAANCPTTQSTSGDWVPPCVEMPTNNRIILTHPGYDGTTYFIGWIDISSFSSVIQGDTNSNTTINNLHSNVLTAGWQVGMLIAGANIPANTYITNIAANGLSVTISNAATASVPNTSFTVTGGTPAAPLYGAGNTAPVALVARPNCVGAFNGRAWYGVANNTVYSDSALPTNITNASQALTLGDNTNVTALKGLPLTSQVTGGIVQALIAFKGAGAYYQITGDPATSNLNQNLVNGSVGTLAPNTICATPRGLAYIAPDGLRVLTLTGVCQDPIGAEGTGFNTPFSYAVNPTRMCMAYNNHTLRVSFQNGFINGQPVQEYWFNMTKNVWSGPHSFPASLIQPNVAQGLADNFVLFANGVNAKLWTSDTEPSGTSTYTENGVAMSWTFQPTLFPDNDNMSGNQVIECSLAMQMPAGQVITILAIDETGSQLGLTSLSVPAGTSSLWGTLVWGSGAWGANTGYFQQYPVNWSAPLVFKQMSIHITGSSIAGAVIGNLYVRVQPTGYLLK